MENIHAINFSTVKKRRNSYLLSLKMVLPVGKAEEQALKKWFPYLGLSNALQMAMKHGGRVLIVGGKKNA